MSSDPIRHGRPARRAVPPGRDSLALALRLLAALAGGYVVANLAAVAVGEALPIARVDAAYTGFLLGFAVYAGVVVWAFAAATARRVWLGLAVVAVPCLAVIGAARFAGGG